MQRIFLILVIIFALIVGSWGVYQYWGAKTQTACHGLEQHLLAELNIPFKYQIVTQKDQCTVTAAATGKIVESEKHQSYPDVVNAVRNSLHQHGWLETPESKGYAADGVYSTQFALEKDKKLAITSIQVTAEDYSTCPGNQPIDIYNNCKLTPEQRDYLLKITIK